MIYFYSVYFLPKFYEWDFKISNGYMKNFHFICILHLIILPCHLQGQLVAMKLNVYLDVSTS